jgi:type II secretory ATPase GspE/PulE/Tfp pilus assembly ATPase PilB-like protein
MHNQRIGHILKEQGLINDKALDFCLSVQKSHSHERICKLLRDYDFISDEQIVNALALQVGWGVFQGRYEVAQEMVKLLGVDFISKHLIFPARAHEGVVFIMAFSDDMAATDEIESKLNAKASFMLAPEADLRKEIDKLSAEKPSAHGEVGHIDYLPTWFEQCFQDALNRGATDIHIEPSIKAVEIRFRIDGILHFYQTLKLEVLKRLVNVIFHKAEVTISDFGKFHDARFSYKHQDFTVDVRVSHIPCVQGSALVLRLLDKNKASIPLLSLGYPQEQWDKIETKLIKPEGMILIVGPTGCGKTTTLYSMLNFLKGIERKILTIEDPVEMHHSLLTQVQMNEKREITFGNSIRAFLRHDPNIILIGEIRDGLTAQEAIRASMTGHKVFATLHAKQGMDAFLRLNDLGVPYAYMSSNISMIITQRLVRMLCPKCKQQEKVVIDILPKHMHKYVDGIQEVWQPVGCSDCYSGYKGRSVIASIIDCNEKVEELLLASDIAALKEYFKREGATNSMFEQISQKIQTGSTSLQEAVRVLG